MLATLFVRMTDLLPEGRSLSDELWRRRHHGLVRLLWLHVVGVAVYALVTNQGILHSLAEASIVAVGAVVGASDKFGRKVRSAAVAIGLVSASAVLVHLSGGLVELHFHYFVMIGLLSLYQEWTPFLCAIGFVALQHGVMGVLDPGSVYNHAAALNNPWKWAAIHGAFVLCASVANLLAWRLNEHQALHDGLTGLPNRVLLSDRIEHALVRRGNITALLFIDVDNFKNINDSFGHTVGDELLLSVGTKLKECVRQGDSVARLGGDEFAVLLEDMEDSTAALRVAERILASVREPVTIQGREIVTTVSIGIAVNEDRMMGAEELTRRADMAMYAAKRRGRARYEMFESSLHAATLDRMALQADLHGALERDEFVLYYQPVVGMQSGEITGMEALVRWQHPHRGLVLPNEFIPLLEESGLIVPVGAWILERACAQVAAWNLDRVEPLSISVNVSPRQLRDAGIVDVAQRALKRAGLAASLLQIEITENVFVEHSDAHLARLHELRALGIRIAIDDFGTGYSSLSYLRRLPIDVVKVDRSFVSGLGEDAAGDAMVDAIVRLCDGLALGIVAEGVETIEQSDALQRLGVDLAQGFYYFRPEPASRCADVLSPRPAVPVAV